MSAERLLRLILLLGGCVLLTAAPFVLIPTDWMASSHRWLGLGEFPDAPLTQYLTRSIAALYAVHGVFLLLAASDVRRYRGLVRVIGATDVVFGLTLLTIDLKAGMPTWWTVVEGPSIMVVGALVLILSGQVPGSSPATGSTS